MDNLQPLIKHRFWILFGVNVLMIVVVFFMVTGSMGKKANARKSAIEIARNGIPKTGHNKSHIEEMTKVNGKRADNYVRHGQTLFDRQRGLRVYEKSIDVIRRLNSVGYGTGPD
ncbi:MAG: hypothetical protein IID45_08690, partial [Planctomycetes bacterium]|nr:hypothetical protein [Planctomycetota bacterium]